LVLLMLALAAGLRRPACAQQSGTKQFTMVLRDVPLKHALEKLVAATEISLAYDSDLARDVRVFCSATSAAPERILRCILNDTDLDFYQTSAGTYVLTASPRQEPRYGRLAGVVVDQATGEPLPHANVLLADAGVGTAANEAGLFAFSSLVSGSHRVVATYVGYETTVDSVRVAPGDSVRQRIALRARPVQAAPVVVNGLQQRLPSQGLGRGELTAEELRASGSVGTPDVARGASSLLGVSLQEPLAGLHIQGGAGGEHQLRLDGMPIRNPVTLGRLLGAFSPLAIERLTAHKAGFGVEHGSRLSGVIAAEHALAPSGDRNLTVQADPLSANGAAQGRWKLPGGRSASAMIAARKSMWGMYSAPVLSRLFRRWHVVDPLLAPGVSGSDGTSSSPAVTQHRADVEFSDVHGAARFRFSPFHTVYASFYRGHNMVNSRAEMPPVTTAAQRPDSLRPMTRDRYHWTNWSGQVRYEWMLGARMMGSLRLHGSRQSLGHGYRMLDLDAASATNHSYEVDSPYDGNKINEVGLKATLDYSVTSRHHLRGALNIKHIGSQALINNDFFRPLAYESASWQLAGYVRDEFSLGLRTTVTAGTRLTYVADRRTLYAEPRLAVRYDGTHARLGSYAFRLAGGLYRQFTNRLDVGSTGPTAIVPSLRFWLPVDHSLAPPRAFHLAAGALWKPIGRWKLNLELYYKHQPRLLAVDYPALLTTRNGPPRPMAQTRFVTPTEGRAFGGGFRFRRTGKRIEGELSYSFSNVRRRFPGRFDDRLTPPPWSQPHRLSLKGRFKLTSALTARLRWRGVWGRSWGFRRAYYDYLAPQSAPGDYAPFDLSAPASHTLPPLYRLDAGLTYALAWSGFSLEARLDLLNVLDRRNAFDWSLRPTGDGYEKIARTMPGRRPSLSLRIGY
jgi:hypothetical protein